MGKASERAVIQCLWKKVIAPQEVHENMVQAVSGDSPYYALLNACQPNLTRAEQASMMKHGQENQELSFVLKGSKDLLCGPC